MIRFVVAATTLIVALLCVPEMLVPVFNTADIIVALAPVVIVLIFIAPRAREWLVEDIGADHPDSTGSLDALANAHELPPTD